MGPASKPPQTNQSHTANWQNARQQPGLAPPGQQRIASPASLPAPNQKAGPVVTPWGEPASEYLRRQEGKVEYFELFTSAGVQKDYGSFMMVYDGWRFKKCPHMVDGYEVPSEAEIRRFRRDVAEAGEKDGRIARLINHEPKLQEEFPPPDCF